MFCIFVFIFDAKRLYIICNFSETCSAAYKEILSINKIKLHKSHSFKKFIKNHNVSGRTKNCKDKADKGWKVSYTLNG